MNNPGTSLSFEVAPKDYNIGNDYQVTDGTITFTAGPLKYRSKLADDLRQFHLKFGFHNGWQPTIHNLDQRAGMMEEELSEYREALAERDKVKLVDAVIDLIYFAVGTLDLLDVDFDGHWDAVQLANMQKVRGTKSTRPNSLGFDCIKPEGWVAPERAHEAILREQDFNFVIELPAPVEN